MRALILIPVLASAIGYGQAGSLDPTFGTGGIVTTEFGAGQDEIIALAVQADGKLVGAGYSYDLSIGSIALVRYNADGTLDNSFGADGKVTTATGATYEYAGAVAVQPDGKILAAGSSDVRMIMTRYLPDGTLDNSFDGDGIVIADIGIGSGANDMALQPDGKILLAGVINPGTTPQVAVVRFNADGSLDTSFDGDGYVLTDLPGSTYERAYSIALQADGRIVVAGSTGVVNADEGLCLMRYNADGSLDNTFDGDGILIPVAGGTQGGLSDVAIQPDGKVVVTGWTYDGVSGDLLVLRLNTDGSYDNSFAGNGLLLTPDSSPLYVGVVLALQPDGKCLVAGTVFVGADLAFAIVRWNADGSPDLSFDGDALATAPMPTWCGVRCMILDQSGRILVGGYSRPVLNNDMTLARYSNDVVSVEEFNTVDPQMVIYPNPAADHAWVDVDLAQSGKWSWSLLDDQGRTVRTFRTDAFRPAGHGHELVDLAGVPGGVYVVRFECAGTRVHARIVVQ